MIIRLANHNTANVKEHKNMWITLDIHDIKSASLCRASRLCCMAWVLTFHITNRSEKMGRVILA